MVYDVMIIGGGPAGLTAAIYAARAALKAVIVERELSGGGQIIDTYEVDNYPGLPGISGFDLADKFQEHSNRMGVETILGAVKQLRQLEPWEEKALEEEGLEESGWLQAAGQGIVPEPEESVLSAEANESSEEEKRLWEILLEDGSVYQTRTVVIATGARHRKLGVPGEDRLTGAGVSYCATCDGAFFRDKDVAVVGGGDVAVEDAIFLARLCRKVYVIHRRDTFRAAGSLSKRLMELPNVEILWDTIVEEISGKSEGGREMVDGILTFHKKTEQRQTIAVDGVFLAVGIVPNTDCFTGVVELDEGGYIRASETGGTSAPGIFAAGDVRTKALRQIITAAADGANAIASIERYLQ